MSELFVQQNQEAHSGEDDAPDIGALLSVLRGRLRQMGLIVTLETDFHALLAHNRKHENSTWYPLTPMFDPRVSDVGPDRAFWLCLRDRDGEFVGAQCAKLYDWRGTDFKEEAESLRFVYADPQASAFPEEVIFCSAPSAAKVRGLVCYSGNAWFHPKVRGKGLSKVLPLMSRALAWHFWDTDMTCALSVPALVQKGVVAKYGYRNVEAIVDWRNCFFGEVQLYLLWKTRQELFGDVRAGLRLLVE